MEPYWEDRAYWPPWPFLLLTPTTHSCPSWRFSPMKTDTPSNKSITAEKKLSNGNLVSKRNVLICPKIHFFNLRLVWG